MTERTSVRIRPSVPGDAGYAAYMHARYYSEYHGFRDGAEYYFIKYLADFVHDPNGGRLWIAESGGVTVGSIAVVPVDGRTAQLRWFLVDKEYQNKGIGSMLIRVAIDFCKDSDIEDLFLWTFKGLDAARHLYDRAGFILTDEKRNTEWSSCEITEQKMELRSRNVTPK